MVMTVTALPEAYKGMIQRAASKDFWIPLFPKNVDCPVSFKTRDAAEEWLVMNLPRLEGLGVKLRHCITCQEQFLSHGRGNRMCQGCRRIPQGEAPVSIVIPSRRAGRG